MDHPTPPPDLARLFDGSGRLTQMPVKAGLRRELLGWIATTLPADQSLTETEMNACLRWIQDDVATVRRYLVEAKVVERPEPGVYRRSGTT